MSTTTTAPFAIRMPRTTRRRLERQAQVADRPKSQLALRYIEEGLQTESHPGIYFRPGPAGRRPTLVGGPDVWEVARVLRDVDESGDQAIAATEKLLDLPHQQVRAVAAYYADFRAEIDAWIERVDLIAAEAEASWRRQQ